MVHVKKAFSLAELMVVVAIIAILATISFPIYSKHKARSHRSEAMPCVTDVAVRLENYRSNHGEYPDSNDWVSLQLSDECGHFYRGAYRTFDDNQRYVISYRGKIWKDEFDIWSMTDVSNKLYHLADPIDGKSESLPSIELPDGTTIDYDSFKPTF